MSPEEGHNDDLGAGAPLLQRLRKLVLFNLEKRRLWGNLLAAFQYLEGATGKLERDNLPGSVVILQGGMDLN